jgi:hypothetical protein
VCAWELVLGGSALLHALAGQGRRPLPASPCSASQGSPPTTGRPALLQMPSRARALVSAVGCPQTSFFSLLCTPVVLTCPRLPEPHSAYQAPTSLSFTLSPFSPAPPPYILLCVLILEERGPLFVRSFRLFVLLRSGAAACRQRHSPASS